MRCGNRRSGRLGLDTEAADDRLSAMTTTGVVDLRSDVITQPTEEMWEAMRSTELGWSVVGEDTRVCALEAYAAQLAGKEAGLFVISGSTGNLVALLSHASRGDQIV